MTRRRLLFLAVLLVACGGEDDAAERPGAPCSEDGDCAEDQVCAVGRVREAELEPGDEARCVAREKAIGRAAPRWELTGGGRPLAERLCLAGGIDRGTGAGSDATRARQKQLFEATGARVVRLDFPWSVAEPEKGKLDFSQLDPMVEVALSAKLEVIGIIAYGTPWASSLAVSDDKYPPDDPADYESYARALAKHYAGKVRRWELWNEPNGGWRFFRPKLNGDAAKYGQMMRAAADAIHAECADCSVYSAGLFFHDQVVNGALEFTHDMLTSDAAAFDSVDGYGIHPYTLYPPKAAPEDDTAPERALSGMADDIAQVFAQHDALLPPLAATELGWPSYAPVSEDLQASFLAREVLLGATLGMDPLCWFNLADGPKHGSFPPEDDFGLYRFGSDDPARPIDPKPARDAFALLSKLGAGAVPAGASSLGGFHAPAQGRFALELGSFVALWHTGDAPESLHLPGETRHALDVTGKLVAEPAGGALDLSVGSSPLFLVE